jgi:hypothetical protein
MADVRRRTEDVNPLGLIVEAGCLFRGSLLTVLPSPSLEPHATVFVTTSSARGLILTQVSLWLRGYEPRVALCPVALHDTFRFHALFFVHADHHDGTETASHPYHSILC